MWFRSSIQSHFLEIDFYKAIDFSASMCELHPKASNIEVKCFDFDTQEFYK